MYLRNGKWYSDFIHKGERYVKSWGEITKSRAKEKDRKFRVEVKEGRYQQKAKRITFKKFSEKYLQYIGLNRKPNTHRKYSYSIQMLSPYFDNLLIEKIQSALVEPGPVDSSP